MRRTICILVSFCLFVSPLYARPKPSWGRLERLKSGSPLLIKFSDGVTLEGHFVSAYDGGLTVGVVGDADAQVYFERHFERAAIWQIILIREDTGSPNLTKCGLIGGGIGALLGGAALRGGGAKGVLVGGLTGLALGANAGMDMCETHAEISASLPRPVALIYEDPHNTPRPTVRATAP